jgi:DNA-binding response OmpR family regulator
MNNNERRILLVDDEPDIAFALSVGLEDNGFIVDTFNDPLLALQSFKEKEKNKKSYALALIDIKMPKMNGFKLYNEMKKVDGQVKVCFITAFDIQKGDELLNALAALTDHDKPTVIQKPIAMEELVKRLKEEIQNS